MRRSHESEDEDMRRRGAIRRSSVLVCGYICLFACIFACTTEKPPEPQPSPVPAVTEAPPEEKPDVIKIAIRFVEWEGRADALVVEDAYIKSQNFLFYIVGFPRKQGESRPGEALVKVHKMDGFAEWEEY
jgi:hypothetical protein